MGAHHRVGIGSGREFRGCRIHGQEGGGRSVEKILANVHGVSLPRVGGVALLRALTNSAAAVSPGTRKKRQRGAT